MLLFIIEAVIVERQETKIIGNARMKIRPNILIVSQELCRGDSSWVKKAVERLDYHDASYREG